MSKHEESHNEHFEELCALAAIGQIEESEFVELRDHMQICSRCQSLMADFTDLTHDKLPLADPEVVGSPKVSGFFFQDSSYRDRFLARARREGLAMATPAPIPARSSSWRIIGTVAAGFVIAVVIGSLSYSLSQSNARYSQLASEMATLSARLNRPVEASPVVVAQTPAPTTIVIRQPPNTEELTKARENQAAAEQRLKGLDAELQSAAAALQSLKTQGDEASRSRSQLEGKLKDAEDAVARALGEVETIRRGRSQDAAMMTAQASRIDELSRKLDEQTETLERDRDLLAASRDIRDLMGARNLHIIDVGDVDSKGKNKKSFARVFYTEGKNLTFVAYDLNDRAAERRNASFQVWGTRQPSRSPVQSLGILYVDDQSQNRWMLHFDDPRVLLEIDTVFVTVEPPGGSKTPSSNRILNAYLGADANHP